MSSQELIQLLERYAAKQTSVEEEDRLVELFSKDQYKDIILGFLEKHWEADTGTRLFPQALAEEKAGSLFSLIAVAAHEQGQQKKAKTVFMRWAVAASLVLLAGIGWIYQNRAGLATDSANQQKLALLEDVAAPVRSLAVLAADGASRFPMQEYKSSAETSAGYEVREANGKKILDYSKGASASQTGVGSQHELINPRGSKQIILYLSDATKVVLNAGSRLKYPSYFAATERMVELEGEAYFEVAKDKTRPFRVQTGNAVIQVLGTHFNVDTHDQQNRTAVTLLEGSIKIVKGADDNILYPGQKAIIATDIDIVREADTTQAIAWTNDLFNFKGMELKEILLQISEWYDVVVMDIESLPEMKLSGIISRDLPVSKILELISMSSGLQFKIQGKNISRIN
ncbi:FecR domain-containing protein [Flavihumibacter sp. CACIAM 22H1]|uniref:FecR family protein n=1 Tax=Flavihumibacter sp. CACIAM 22H1 TaxID=1812911 RepID=UPI0007A8FD90|nr:FecR domain-containing protein [Flavihumibacter sp. CACIAM 22H1]KYP15366.1 MAG: hypothetical protein A1D16_16415 [Flavihumibacter sp. CACIAM 22H1]